MVDSDRTQMKIYHMCISCWIIKARDPQTHRMCNAYEGVLISPEPEEVGNKLQRPNSAFIQYTPHEAQYTS